MARKKRISKAKKQKALEPEIIDQNNKSLATTGAVSATDPMAQYLTEISKYPVLSKADEKKIAIDYYETKDPKLAEVLLKSNLRFVVKIAAEYSKFGARLIDLVQEGNVGLMHAVKEFNPYKGVKLITYAVWWIRGYIQEYLMRQYSLVRIGTTQNQRKLFYQLQKHKSEFEELGYNEAIKQLSGQLDISEDEIKDMKNRMSGGDISLNETVGDDSSTTFLDLQSDEYQELVDDQLESAELVQLLKDNIEQMREDLNDREKYLLENRLLSDEPKTLQEIGNNYGITREAVRQMEIRLIKKIKEQMGNQTALSSLSAKN